MKKILMASILSVMVVLAGCSNKAASVNKAAAANKASTSSNISTNTSSNTADSASNTSANKKFTIEELKTYNGQNGNPAYVAVDGVVYDVTHANGWRNGKHRGGATAGNDLSQEINKSPHGKDVLKDLPVVGKLK